MLEILTIGISFGFAGFLLETVQSTIEKKHYVYCGDKLFWGIPFLPIYAFGGLLMHYILLSLQGSPWYWAIFVAWIAVCGWEYVAGFFCHRVLGKKFWNYTKHKYNLHSYICLRNSLWWLFFITLYYLLFF
jgi:uncharacterized membrane protein